jgi:hypothetical protein
VQVFLVFGLCLRNLTGALARQAEQLLDLGALGKFGLALQLRQDLHGLGIIPGSHRLAALVEQRIALRGLQWRIDAYLFHGRKRWLGNYGVGVVGDRVIAHGEPGARIVFRRRAQHGLGDCALIKGAGPQPIPFFTAGLYFRNEGLRLQALGSLLDGPRLKRLPL